MQILLIMLIVVLLAFSVLLLALAKQSPREKQTEDKEYIFKIVLSGFFEIKNAENISDKETLIHKNAVAIMMPYLRSEVSLLTSQPETNSIVMPIFNINKMIK